MSKLAGKVALIRGAARGQGEAEARLFVAGVLARRRRMCLLRKGSAWLSSSVRQPPNWR
jgi:NAD(P)-dependent dehydrogenase (short-subunit alcohol dehydrogenase family)